MQSLITVRVLLFFASMIVFGVSILLIQKNSRSRKGGDHYVRSKQLKTIGWILLFPAVLLMALAALSNEIGSDSGIREIDPAAVAVAQAYVPPVLPQPTTSLLSPNDPGKSRLSGTTNDIPDEPAPSPLASESLDLAPSAAAPFATPASVSPPTPSRSTSSAVPTPSRADQLDADLAAATARIAANPKDAEAYGIRGNLYAMKRAWPEAERDYQSVLALDSDSPKAKFNLAEMSFLQKKYDVARAAFVALEQDPETGDLAAYKVFLCDLISGKMDVAAQELDAFNKVGSHPSYYFANATWAINHRKQDEARGWLKSANHIYPQAKFRLYASPLREMGYLPLPAASN